MRKIIVQEMEPEQLLSSIREIVRSEIQEKEDFPKTDSNLTYWLTRKEVAKLLKVSLSTLHQWVKEGLVPAHRIGTRVRFKESEIMGSLKEIKSIRYIKGGML